MPTITIDMTSQQASRLADAWEEQFGARPSLADVKMHLVQELKSIVFHAEKVKAERLIQPPAPFEPI